MNLSMYNNQNHHSTSFEDGIRHRLDYILPCIRHICCFQTYILICSVLHIHLVLLDHRLSKKRTDKNLLIPRPIYMNLRKELDWCMRRSDPAKIELHDNSYCIWKCNTVVTPSRRESAESLEIFGVSIRSESIINQKKEVYDTNQHYQWTPFINNCSFEIPFSTKIKIGCTHPSTIALSYLSR